MTLSAQRCYQLMEHAIHGPIEGAVGRQDLLNLCGEHLVNMHDWLWLVRPWNGVKFRAKITLADATWTESSKTLTKTGAFADYDWLAGDQVEITDGTGAEKAFYRVASKTSSNAIVLETSIGAAADTQTDIDGTLELTTVALPNDGNVRSVTAYTSRDSFANVLEMVSYKDLLYLRSNGIAGSWTYSGAITYGKGQPDGAPVPLLDIHPAPTVEEANALKLFCVHGWERVSDDQDEVQVPVWLEPFFIHLCREYAMAFDDDEGMGLDERLARLGASPLFLHARKRDSELQPDVGLMRGGAGLRGRRRWRPYLTTPVNPPN